MRVIVLRWRSVGVAGINTHQLSCDAKVSQEHTGLPHASSPLGGFQEESNYVIRFRDNIISTTWKALNSECDRCLQEDIFRDEVGERNSCSRLRPDLCRKVTAISKAKDPILSKSL